MKAEEQEVDVDGMDISPDLSPILPKRALNTSAGSTSGSKSISKPSSSTSTSNHNNNNNNHSNNNNQTKSNSKSPTSTGTNTKGKEAGKIGSGGGGGKKRGKGVMDEDIMWAEEDPDDDEKGWKMRVSKGAAELAEEIGV